MEHKELRQTKTNFSGDRLRLETHTVDCTEPFCVVGITHEIGRIEATNIYLPYEQRAALKEATDAFNAVMDAHESAATAPALEVEAA